MSADGDWCPRLSSSTQARTEPYFTPQFWIHWGSKDGKLVGIGGGSESVWLATTLKLLCSDGVSLNINGPFPAFTDPLVTDCSILGRDVLKLFTLIADPFTKTLCLIRDRHAYTISES